MAVQASGVATLVDVLSEMAPGGGLLDVAEVLTQSNPVLEDMLWQEGNKVTGHMDAMRTVLPTPSFRALNAGVPVTKSGSTTVEETTALLEDFSQVDRELAIMSGDVNRYRLKEARPHVQGMSNRMATEIFYGNANANPLGFTGLTPRYNTLNTSVNKGAANVINAGGTGSNLRSIWLVGWGEDTIFGIYPKGTRGGLDHEDATNATGTGAHGFPAAARLLDLSGNSFMGYADHWIWRVGLFVKDWRFVVRIANIDETALTLSGATGPKLQDLMTQAVERIENLGGRTVFYMPRNIQSFMRRQLLEQKNAFLGLNEVGGRKVLDFSGVPIKRTDALNVAETQVI